MFNISIITFLKQTCLFFTDGLKTIIIFASLPLLNYCLAFFVHGHVCLMAPWLFKYYQAV